MIWVWVILFLAPGFLSMEMIEAGKLSKQRERRNRGRYAICFLGDILIFGGTYLVFRFLKGVSNIDFTVKYQEKMEGFTVFDNAFVIQYALVEVVLAVGIGMIGRMIADRKISKRAKKNENIKAE